MPRNVQVVKQDYNAQTLVQDHMRLLQKQKIYFKESLV